MKNGGKVSLFLMQNALHVVPGVFLFLAMQRCPD
jgi:hypothetical protein